MLPLGVVLDADGRHLIERFTISSVEDAGAFARSASLGSGPAHDAPVPPTLLVAGAFAYDGAEAPTRCLDWSCGSARRPRSG